MEKVIKARVLIDANIVGGVQAVISLANLAAIYRDSNGIVFEIPLELTGGREIMSVLSVNNLPHMSAPGNFGMGNGSAAPTSMTDLAGASMKLMNSHGNIPSVSNASCELVGYNTVLIRDQLMSRAMYSLRCMLANESHLSNISPRSYLSFATLCVHAVKAYIYNTMLITIDQAYLSGGQELGSMKNYVETLSDAEENYRTYLDEVWMKTAFMNDQVTFTRHIKSMFSTGI